MKHWIGKFRNGLLAVALICLLIPAWADPVEARRPVRVGAPNYLPLIAQNSEGEFVGLYADLLRAMAEKEDWNLEFISDDWPKLMDRLANGELDLMTCIAPSEDRAERLDFNESSVFVSWGQVYSGKGVQVESVLDLKGQPLALVRKDINSANFKKLAAGFQVKIDYLEVDSYDQAGKLVSLGQAKAMILPNVLSRPFAGRYHLHPTPIIFNPVTSSFASPKGKNNDLLQAIDRHLQNWKQDKISVYYAIVDKWLPAAPPEPLFSRNQISALLYGLILIGALLAAWMGALRHQVKTRTRDLTESEERYRRLFDTSPVGVISHRDGKIILANKAAMNILEAAKEEELLGLDLYSFVHPDDRKRLLERRRRAMEEGAALDLVEARYITRRGREIYCEVAGSVVNYGENPAVQSILRDVTAHKKAAEELAKSEERFTTAFNASPLWLAISTRAEGRFLEINEAFCNITGHSRAEVLGRTAFELNYFVNHDDRSRAMGFMNRDGRLRDFELDFRLKDGTIHTFLWFADPIEFMGQDCLINSMVDITRRKQVEAELASIFRAAPVGIAVLKTRAFVKVNEEYCRILGYSAEELLGQGTEILYTNRSSWEEVGREVYEQIRDQGLCSLETKMIRRDGRLIDVVLNGSPAYADDPEREFIFALTDITERKRAEIALRESEERYRNILEVSPAAILITRISDGRYLEVNRAFETISGWAPEEVLGRTALELNMFVNPEDRARGVGMLREKGRFEGFEYQTYRRDGSIATVLSTGRPIVYRGEECLISVAMDITDMKQAEEALRESEERYRSVMEAAYEPLVVYDTEGRVGFVNPGFTRVFGWSAEELLGRRIDFVPEDRREEVREAFRRTFEEGKVSGYETQRLTKDGRILDVNISAAIIRDRTGEPVGSVVNLNDITERKRAELKLQRQNRFLDSLHNTTVGLIERIDQEDLLQGILRRATELVKTPHGWVATKSRDGTGMVIRVGTGALEERVGRRMKPEEGITGQVWRTGERIEVDDILTKPWGTKVVYRKTMAAGAGFPLKSGNEVVGVLGLGRDRGEPAFKDEEMEILARFAQLASITLDNTRSYASLQRELAERKRAEKALRKSEAELARHREHLEELVQVRTGELSRQAGRLADLNSELTEFTYAVSHDLKAPLRAIHNYADFLREDLDGELEEEQQTYLDGLVKAVLQGEVLVNDLLTLSRVGRREEAPERIELSQLIREATVPFQADNGLKLVIGSDWPSLTVAPGLLLQLLQNLISNAVKFNDKPEKQVEIGWRPDGTDRVELYVTDNGIGIDPQHQERIFSVFQRLHTSREYEGSGVGLAIVKKAAAKLQGRIGLESRPGDGSTFRVSLPLAGPGGNHGE